MFTGFKFIKPEPTEPISAILGDSQNLNCTTTDPNATTSLWFKSGLTFQQLKVDDVKVFRVGAVYTLKDLVLLDQGLYQCRATNSLGVSISWSGAPLFFSSKLWLYLTHIIYPIPYKLHILYHIPNPMQATHIILPNPIQATHIIYPIPYKLHISYTQSHTSYTYHIPNPIQATHIIYPIPYKLHISYTQSHTSYTYHIPNPIQATHIIYPIPYKLY